MRLCRRCRRCSLHDRDKLALSPRQRTMASLISFGVQNQNEVWRVFGKYTDNCKREILSRLAHVTVATSRCFLFHTDLRSHPQPTALYCSLMASICFFMKFGTFGNCQELLGTCSGKI
jgi:hypothetical protein